MKAKTLVLMGVAIVCGLTASYMTSRLINERNATVKVLIARSDLKQWTSVRDPAVFFEAKDVLKNEAPPSFVEPSALAETKDRAVAKNIKKGQVVTWDDLQSKDKMSLECGIPEGMRAVAIETSAKTTTGFVLPGSHVDLILVKRGQLQAKAEYLMENVLVRAVDLMQERPPDKPGMVPSTVTLQVTPAQALTLAGMTTQGQIVLSLRPVDDKSSSADAAAALKLPPPPPPPIREPDEHASPDLPPPIKTKPWIVSGFDGKEWVRFMYKLDEEGNVISGPFPLPINE